MTDLRALIDAARQQVAQTVQQDALLKPLARTIKLPFHAEPRHLACFVAALFRWFKRPSRLIVVIALCSAILCINAKLIGVVYLCFVSAGAGIYTLVKRRDVFWRHAAIQVSAMLLGTLVFGFNPYVTNTWHRGNPLYPKSGGVAVVGTDHNAVVLWRAKTP